MTIKDKFLRNVKSGKGKSTIYTINHALDEAEANIGKSLDTAEWDDILTHIEKMQEKNFTSSTINLHKSKLKQFFSFCYDETEDVRYRKILKNLKGNKIIGEPPKPYEILTPEEVKRLINVANLERDKCMIAAFFESGMRIGELHALTNKMVQVDDQKQEVIFNIPNQEGCKTGSRTVICLEIYGYVRDWLKCNTSDKFIPISPNGMRVKLIELFKKAGINKPSNPHNFRHSAITYAVNIGMQQNAICMRFWGVPNSNMLSTYIHLNEQMTSQGYRNAKGMGNSGDKVINPLAVRCVECGKLIETGNICKSCNDTKKISEENEVLKNQMLVLSKDIEALQTKNAILDHENTQADTARNDYDSQIDDLKTQMESMNKFMQKLITSMPPDITNNLHLEIKEIDTKSDKQPQMPYEICTDKNEHERLLRGYIQTRQEEYKKKQGVK